MRGGAAAHRTQGHDDGLRGGGSEEWYPNLVANDKIQQLHRRMVSRTRSRGAGLISETAGLISISGPGQDEIDRWVPARVRLTASSES